MKWPESKLSAEMFFQPRVVRSGTEGQSRKAQAQINEAVSDLAARRTATRTRRIIDKADRKKSPSSPSHGVSLEQELAVSQRLSDIRDAQRHFLKTSDWINDADDDTRESMLRLIELRMDGKITQKEYSATMRSSRDAVRGPSVRDPNYYTPVQHPWRLPYGW
jgi:hypothetical protein